VTRTSDICANSPCSSGGLGLLRRHWFAAKLGLEASRFRRLTPVRMQQLDRTLAPGIWVLVTPAPVFALLFTAEPLILAILIMPFRQP